MEKHQVGARVRAARRRSARFLGAERLPHLRRPFPRATLLGIVLHSVQRTDDARTNPRGARDGDGQMRRRMTKTMSIRMDRENYEFLNEITKEERSDLSKAVRDLVMRGRVLLAVERYKKGEASLGKAAQLAGLSVGRMMTLLAEFGVESRIEKDDYLQGLKNLANAW